MPLPRKLFDRIEKASVNFGIENQTASSYIAYRRGATEWTEKAQGLIDALEMARREIVALYKTKGYSKSFVTRTIDEALAKYKEVTNG